MDARDTAAALERIAHGDDGHRCNDADPRARAMTTRAEYRRSYYSARHEAEAWALARWIVAGLAVGVVLMRLADFAVAWGMGR